VYTRINTLVKTEQKDKFLTLFGRLAEDFKITRIQAVVTKHLLSIHPHKTGRTSLQKFYLGDSVCSHVADTRMAIDYHLDYTNVVHYIYELAGRSVQISKLNLSDRTTAT
jgi:hypothetical protein